MKLQPCGKVLVRFNQEGMTLKNMRDLEERIQRNLDAAEKLDEFYRLRSAWLIPITCKEKSCRKTKTGGRSSFDFPRKFPF
jgi:hypothetical protein